MVSEEEQRAARAKVITALGVFALVLVVVIAGLIWASSTTSSSAGSDPTVGAGGESAAPAPPVGAAPAAGGWDTAGQAALAARPMRQFPDSASLPQTLATTSLPVIAVPTATRANPAGVGEGFPATVEGAIGQLAALEVVGLKDLNPDTYNAAYVSVSLPGAPTPGATPLGYQVARNYDQIVGSGTTTITSRWQLAGAQVKGVTDGGRAAVVCVSGQLQAAAQNTVQVATGDCQAMRFTGTDWRIAPVPPAARAPITWPGTDAFNQAGYHPTDGGPT